VTPCLCVRPHIEALDDVLPCGPIDSIHIQFQFDYAHVIPWQEHIFLATVCDVMAVPHYVTFSPTVAPAMHPTSAAACR